jgi:hypothetical protein
VLVYVVLIVMDGLFHNSNCAGALVNRDRTSTVCPEGFSNTRSIVLSTDIYSWMCIE